MSFSDVVVSIPKSSDRRVRRESRVARQAMAELQRKQQGLEQQLASVRPGGIGFLDAKGAAEGMHEP